MQNTTVEEIAKRHYPFVAQAGEDGWYIHFPDLPGAQTFAATWDDVARNAQEVLKSWIAIMVDEGAEIPAPTMTDDADDVLPWDVDHFIKRSTFTTADVAVQLGISRRRVLALAHQRGVGTKRGRDLIFTSADIDAMRHRIPGRPVSADRMA